MLYRGSTLFGGPAIPFLLRSLLLPLNLMIMIAMMGEHGPSSFYLLETRSIMETVCLVRFMVGYPLIYSIILKLPFIIYISKLLDFLNL